MGPWVPESLLNHIILLGDMDFPTELGIIILLSLFSGVLSARFKKPSVLGLIIVGALAGNLGFVQDKEMLHIVTEVGAILLMFTVGIEFNIEKLLKFGFPAIAVGIFKLGGVFAIGYFASHILGLPNIAGIFIGGILSITSTVIFLKVLEQQNMVKRKEIPFLVAILIIEDLFGIFLITFFSSLNQSQDILPLGILTSLALSFLLLFVAYAVILRIFKPMVTWMLRYSTEETTTFMAIGICGLFVYLAITLKLSPTVGAFLAGNIVASIPQAKLFEKAIHPFLLTFTSLFFFSMGAVVRFSSIISNIFPIIFLFLLLIVSVIIMMAIGTYLFANYDGRSAFFSGISMASIGEFSLLIANQSTNLPIGLDLVSVTAALILLSAIFMSLILKHEEKLYASVSKTIPWQDAFSRAQQYIRCIYYEISLDKTGWDRIAGEARRLFYVGVSLAVWLSAGFLAWRFFIRLLPKEVNILFFAAVSIISAALTFFSVKYARLVVADFDRLFLDKLPGESANRMSMTNTVLLLISFGLMVLVPVISLMYDIDYLHIILIIPILLFMILVARLLSGILRLSDRCSTEYKKLSKQIVKGRRR
jgi:Kef-type K+ transport system membrane component KefB